MTMKKTLCLILIFSMLLSLASISAGAREYDYDDMAEFLNKLDILHGDGSKGGSYDFDGYLTRAQFAKLAVASSAYKASVPLKTNTSPYSDVTKDHWAAGYVKVAVQYKMVSGYPDSTFRPENNVLLEEAVTIILKLLGYTNSDFGGEWPNGQMGIAKNIGLLDNVTVTQGQAMTRKDAIALLYNAITGETKQGGVYLNSLGYSLKENVTLISSYIQDSTLDSDEIITSEGNFVVKGNFDFNKIGMRGDLLLKNNKEIIGFFTDGQIMDTYVVTGVLGSNVIVNDNGTNKSITISDETVVYYNSSKITFSALASRASTGDSITVVKDKKGRVKYIKVEEQRMEGPITVTSDKFLSDISIKESEATIIKDGGIVSVKDVEIKDIIYYSKNLNTVWVYGEKRTGIYEEAIPNQEFPTSVKLSGITYEIESATALSKLSSTGKYKIGQELTIMLGKDGKIADVSSGTAIQAKETYVITGILSGKIVVNDKGTNKSITIADETEVYYNSTKTTYSSLLNRVAAGDSLSIIKDSNGKVKYVTVDEQRMEGPITVTSESTVSELPIDKSSATIIKDGGIVKIEKIQPYDILYYSKNLNTVWVYSEKITGIYEEAIPNQEFPTSVKFSGITYEIESVEALTKLSSTGKYKIGQELTIMLGKDGKIAAVSSNKNIQAKETYVVTGVLSGKIIVNENGISKSITIADETDAYYNSTKTTYSSLLNRIAAGDSLSIVKDSNGKIKYITVEEQRMEGPITVTSESTVSELPIDKNNATIIKDGGVVSIEKISVNDIVYYSKNLNTVWVYTEKRTGVYEEAIPNQEFPTSVKLSGITYEIESTTAHSKLSSTGKYKIGQELTVMLGKDGKIADVSSNTNVQAKETYVVAGILSGKIIVNDNGKNKSITIADETEVYYNSSKITYSSLINRVAAGDSLSIVKDNNGRVKYVTVDEQRMEGPITVVSKTFLSNLLIDENKAIIIKGGGISKLDDININDIVYYSENLNTIWVYSDKRTGIYEEAYPNQEFPTSVKLSGITYEIESVEALTKLSSTGDFKLGQVVTVMLGKDGKIADVATGVGNQNEVYGYGISSGSKNYTAGGETYTSYYIVIATPDGKEYEYITDKYYENCTSKVVKLTFTDSVAKVSDFEGKNASGLFNVNNLTLGSSKMIKNVNIIDVKNNDYFEKGEYLKIYPARLDGVNIKASDVLYCEKNENNEITALILKDVTGDCYDYGVTMKKEERGGTKYILDGKEASSGSTFAVSGKTPVKLDIKNNQLEGVYVLNQVKTIKTFTDTYVTDENGKKHYLSDKLSIYYVNSNGDYMLMTLSETIKNKDKYKITAYYDKSADNGGRVRILILK